MPSKSKSKRSKPTKPPVLQTVVAMGTRLETIVDAFIVKDIRHAVELYRRRYGTYPLVVNGRQFIGHCSKTGAVILEGDEWFLPDSTEGFFQLRKAKP